ncbi:hypothetical protein T484DRAFT_1905467, partial [Baffinella frigidus]
RGAGRGPLQAVARGQAQRPARIGPPQLAHRGHGGKPQRLLARGARPSSSSPRSACPTGSRLQPTGKTEHRAPNPGGIHPTFHLLCHRGSGPRQVAPATRRQSRAASAPQGWPRTAAGGHRGGAPARQPSGGGAGRR